MFHKRVLCALIGLAAFLNAHAVDVVQITSTPSANTLILSPSPTTVVVDPGITLTNTSSTPITTVTVVIGNGADTTANTDTLSLPTTSGFTATFQASTLTLTITAASASAAQWQAVLRNVAFSTNSRIARPRIISFAVGNAKPLNTNGHFYEVINVGSNISWTDARDAAAARRLYGLQGYLATITSSAEQSFVQAKISQNAWLGASDAFAAINAVVEPDPFINQAAAEGFWYWVTGPEAGQFFFRGSNRPPAGPVSGAFANWNTNEPNNFFSGTEHYAHFLTSGRWNDLPVFFNGINSTSVIRYVVEYGGMPGDPGVTLQASRAISVDWAPTTITAPVGVQALARPTITGVSNNVTGPSKVEVALDITNDGVMDVVFVTTTANDGSWSINTASASPLTGTMVDVGPSNSTRISARPFNALATSASDSVAYPGPSTTTAFSTDRVAPNAPIISAPASPNNDLTPVVSGSAEPNSIVTVTIDPDGNPATTNSFQVTTTTDQNGAWSFTIPSGTPLIDGTSPTFSATAKDALNNISTASNKTIAVDASAPVPPVISAPGALTNDLTPIIRGNAEPGTTVTVVVDPDNNPATNNNVTWITTANNVGAWEIDTGTQPVSGSLPSGGLPQTTVAIEVVATDSAGNSSAPFSTTTLIDATAPAAPVFTGPSSPTNDATPSVTGTGEPNATLTLTVDVDGNVSTTNDIVIFVVPVAVDGSWAIDTGAIMPTAGTLPNGGFPDGLPIILSATQTDAAGNTSPNASKQLAIDTTAPAAPTLLSPGNITNDLTPTIAGRAEPGSTVQIILDTDNNPATSADRVTLTAIADSVTGAWSVTPTTPLSDGSVTILEATATDHAGNISPFTSALLSIDTTAPIPPVLSAPYPTTNLATPTLTGFIDDDTTSLVVIIDANGDGILSDQITYTLTRGAGLPTTGTTWSLNLANVIPDGLSTPIAGFPDAARPIITLLASDLAANSSAGGGNFAVDLSAPSAPLINRPGTFSADKKPVITGSAEANALITVTVGGVTFTTQATSTGTWQIDTGTATPMAGTVPSAGFPEGSLAITAQATDSAGNQSSVSSSSTIIDSLAPSAPIFTGPSSPTNDATPIITGTGEAGATLTLIIDNDGNPSSTTDAVTFMVVVASNGTWSIDTGSQTPSSGTMPSGGFPDASLLSLVAVQKDAAGNSSVNATTELAIDTTPSSAPIIARPIGKTNDRTPLISGSAEPGDTITIEIDPDNNPATNNSISWLTTADSTGAWFIDTGSLPPLSGSMPSAGLSDNMVKINATATDAGGNISPTTSGFVTIDATPPAAPIITGPTSPTNVAIPIITGNGEAGATLTLAVDADGNLSTTNDVITFMVVVADNGTWAINSGSVTPVSGSVPSGGFPDGFPIIISAQQTDDAGNTSPTSTAQLAIDATPPAAPVVLSPGAITNDLTPTISGTAEPGSIVRVVIDTDNNPATTGDEIILTTVADAQTGAWSVTLSTALADGNVTILSVTATDAAGSISPVTTSSLTVDTVLPVPPTLIAPKPATNNTRPTLSGEIDSDVATLVVTVDPNGDGNLADQVVYTLTRGAGLPATGNLWSLNLDTAIPDSASQPITAFTNGAQPIIDLQSTDSASNTSTGSGTFTVDITSPAAPVINFPGIYSGDNKPIISGTAEPGALITVTVGGVVFTTTATSTGTWQIDTGTATPISGTVPSAGFPEGSLAITAQATDSAGNQSSVSSSSTIIDSLVPSAPIFTGPISPINDATPIITGTGEAGATLTLIIDSDGNLSTTTDAITFIVVVASNGTWSVDTGSLTPSSGTMPSGGFPDASLLSLVAAQKDAVGNSSGNATTELAIDTTPSSAPIIARPLGKTNDRTPLISGSAEPGETITVTIDPDNNPATNNSITWLTVANSTGAWFIDTGSAPPLSGSMPSAGLSDNVVRINATATDASGNISPTASGFVTIDATPPTAPIITGPTSPTNDATPTITGSGEAGATLTLSIDADGNLSTTTDVVTFTMVVAGDGTWAINSGSVTPVSGSVPSGGFPDGIPIILSAQQTDGAGNTSPTSTAQLAIDTTAPAAPLVLSPGAITNDLTPTISGTAEPGSTVRVVIDADNNPATTGDQIILTTVADPLTGAWSVTPSTALVDGNVTILSATATDAAGNTGPAVTSTLTVDTVLPVPPTLIAPKPATNNTRPTLSGEMDSDVATLVVTVDPNGDGNLADQVVYTLTRGAGLPVTGNQWSFNLATAIPDGASQPIAAFANGAQPIINLQSTDSASNTSIGSGTFAVDLTSPVAPVINFPGIYSSDNKPIISGTAEPGALITVTVGGVVFTTTANATGAWYIDTGTATPVSGTVPTLGFPEGALAISATATDKAGNVSPSATNNSFIDSQPPAAPTITGPASLTDDSTPVLSGSAEPGSTVIVTVDPDGNPNTANNVVYAVVANGSGAWTIDTATATPTSGTWSNLAAGTVFTLSVVARDPAGNMSAAATSSSQVVVGFGIAVVTFRDADRQFNGQPHVLPVSVNPTGLALRIRWRLANNPSAPITELDPYNPAHANRWPSAVGTYTMEAIVVEPGRTGSATATLLLFLERSLDLKSHNCGSGGMFAGILLLSLLGAVRFARHGALALMLMFGASQGYAEDSPAANVSDPKPTESETTTVVLGPALQPVQPIHSVQSLYQDLPPWWVLRLGWGPAPYDHSERRSNDTLTHSDWDRSVRLSLLREQHCGWIPGDHDGPLMRIGISLQRLTGDEVWTTNTNDQLAIDTKTFDLSATGFLGWEARLPNGLYGFVGPCGSLGPVIGHLDGRLTSGADTWEDDTYAYGWQFSYGIEGGLGWRGKTWGVELGTGYERQRVSLSYELDMNLDGNDRGETWDRRLNVVGWWWSVGITRLW
jgi:large repetitive protein